MRAAVARLLGPRGRGGLLIRAANRRDHGRAGVLEHIDQHKHSQHSEHRDGVRAPPVLAGKAHETALAVIVALPVAEEILRAILIPVRFRIRGRRCRGTSVPTAHNLTIYRMKPTLRAVVEPCST